jgi:hypothetical protein
VIDYDQPVVYRIAQNDVQKGLDNNKKQPLLDLWSNVIGDIPPFPNASARWLNHKSDLTPLNQAHACFRGIKRPAGDDGRGFDFYALISKPKKHFIFVPDLACPIKLVDVPDDLVHIAYIRCDFPLGRGKWLEPHQCIGVLTHWQYVETQNSSDHLPVNVEERYRQRIW